MIVAATHPPVLAAAVDDGDKQSDATDAMLAKTVKDVGGDAQIPTPVAPAVKPTNPTPAVQIIQLGIYEFGRELLLRHRGSFASGTERETARP